MVLGLDSCLLSWDSSEAQATALSFEASLDVTSAGPALAIPFVKACSSKGLCLAALDGCRCGHQLTLQVSKTAAEHCSGGEPCLAAAVILSSE